MRPANVAARDVEPKPLNAEAPRPTGEASVVNAGLGREGVQNASDPRYRPLPSGAHEMPPGEVERDQRERLKLAMIELIGQRGYQAVRILDLTQLAHVSRPTFYHLYRDKEALLLDAYDDIVGLTAQTVIEASDTDGSPQERGHLALRAFAELAAAEPAAMSLLLFGAFGAGPKALERRNRTLETLERNIESNRNGSATEPPGDLIVKVIVGGIREVAAARLRQYRERELPGLASELTAWAEAYPQGLPANLPNPLPWGQRTAGGPSDVASERARRAEGRLPSGRHELPRQFVLKAQRERIVDATAAIVAEKGLAGLTIPAIASRAQVSHATFYEMYPTKRAAYLGAQKVGMHQAFGIAVEAYEAHKEEGWSHGVAEGLRALILYLHAEPAHAHLSIVDTFAASPETLEVRDETLRAFSVYLSPGERPADIDAPAIASEAVVGGIWQILHDYIESGRLAELVEDTPQLIFLTLAPFLGTDGAAEAALRPAAP